MVHPPRRPARVVVASAVSVTVLSVAVLSVAVLLLGACSDGDRPDAGPASPRAGGGVDLSATPLTLVGFDTAVEVPGVGSAALVGTSHDGYVDSGDARLVVTSEDGGSHAVRIPAGPAPALAASTIDLDGEPVLLIEQADSGWNRWEVVTVRAGRPRFATPTGRRDRTAAALSLGAGPVTIDDAVHVERSWVSGGGDALLSRRTVEPVTGAAGAAGPRGPARWQVWSWSLDAEGHLAATDLGVRCLEPVVPDVGEPDDGASRAASCPPA